MKYSKIVSDGLNFGEHTVKVHIATEEELKKFWELHGRHYNGIMDLKSTFLPTWA